MQTHINTTLEPVLEWQAQTRKDLERSPRWYLVASIFAGALIAYGIVTGAWMMSLAISLGAGLYYLIRNEKHPVISIRILPTGIEYNGIFESWNSWKSFWILMGPDYCELHIARKGLRPDFVILTGAADPLFIRDKLSAYIPHDEKKRESFIDTLSRYCKL